MKKIIISSLAVASLLSITSCKTDFDTDVADIKPVSGEADFSNYVALGNSLTSGYRDDALYSDGQVESYPNMLAAQMKLAGGGEFTQPLIPNNVGGFTDWATKTKYRGKYTLQVVNGELSPMPSAPAAALDQLSGKFNNMGVPGAKSFHLVTPNYGDASLLSAKKSNPYFVRFASSPSTTVLADAMAQKPTFFSLWIGNNDVLGYATSGGDGSDPITPTATFNNAYTALVSQLTSKGAKGVVANIPNVTDIPFFTTVPSKPISEISTAQVTALNAGYAAYNTGLAQAKTLGKITEVEYQQRLISFNANGSNGAVIIDKDLTDLSALGLPSYRQTTSKDFILLNVASALKTGGGTQIPLTDEQVLTEKEVAKIQTATKTYNAQIKELANQYNLAFVDANAKMVELSKNSGLVFNGVTYTTTFVTGGAFSLDGVHLTGRGYAVIANEFIKAINAKYKSTLPQVNPNNYTGVKFP